MTFQILALKILIAYSRSFKTWNCPAAYSTLDSACDAISKEWKDCRPSTTTTRTLLPFVDALLPWRLCH